MAFLNTGLLANGMMLINHLGMYTNLNISNVLLFGTDNRESLQQTLFGIILISD